jgi:hypothetical protein
MALTLFTHRNKKKKRNDDHHRSVYLLRVEVKKNSLQTSNTYKKKSITKRCFEYKHSKKRR